MKDTKKKQEMLLQVSKGKRMSNISLVSCAWDPAAKDTKDEWLLCLSFS